MGKEPCKTYKVVLNGLTSYDLTKTLVYRRHKIISSLKKSKHPKRKMSKRYAQDSFKSIN